MLHQRRWKASISCQEAGRSFVVRPEREGNLAARRTPPPRDYWHQRQGHSHRPSAGQHGIGARPGPATGGQGPVPASADHGPAAPSENRAPDREAVAWHRQAANWPGRPPREPGCRTLQSLRMLMQGPRRKSDSHHVACSGGPAVSKSNREQVHHKRMLCSCDGWGRALLIKYGSRACGAAPMHPAGPHWAQRVRRWRHERP